MENIIVQPKNKSELEVISNYLKQNEISFISEEEYEFQKRIKARKEFARLVKESPKIDITDEEIDAIVEEVRAKRYAEKSNH
jgi:DNA-binding transcriptional regulator YhcF (GntR family)